MADEGKTVLLVEDEAIIALNEANRLKEYGYSVSHASTGEKAIEIVDSGPDSIGIILMDIDLGQGMDGTEAAQRILERYDIPVLFLSSHVERDIVAKTEGITNYGYVVKSSSFTVLDASIKMARKLFEARRRINAVNAKFEAANEELKVSLENLQRSSAELAKSEDKFSKAFDLNPDSININRLSDGVYVNINQGFTQIMGYSKEEVVGRSSLPGNLGIWVREEDRKRLVQGLREKGEVTDLEAEFRRKDGSTTIGWMSARTIEIDGEACILSITKDMGGRKEIERHLQEAELRFRMAFENAPAGIAITAPDGRLRMVNRAFCELVGRSAEELTGADFTSLTHPEDRAIGLEKARLMIAGEARNARFVKRYLRKDGSPVWADVSVTLVDDEDGRPDYFITQILGITSAVAGAHAIETGDRTEQGLLASVERYKSILAVSGIGAWEYRRDTGFLWCSPECFTMLGREPEDYRTDGGPSLDKAWIELLHPDDRERSSRLFADYLSAGSIGLYENQSRMKHRDGRWIWILSRARTLRDRDGRSTDLTLGVHIDITERMLSEDRIRSLLLLYEKLFESKNLQALPLREYLTPLVGEIVGIFPNGSKVRTEIDMPEIILEAKVLSPLGIIVSELVTNAMKYAFEGRPGGTITLRALKTEDRMSLLFEDDGVGLPGGEISAAPKGFGLQLVGMMVQQLHGSLKVERGPGTGYMMEFPA